MVTQSRSFNHTQRGMKKQLRVENMSYVPNLPLVEEFSQSSSQSSDGPAIQVNATIVQRTGAEGRFRTDKKTTPRQNVEPAATSALQDLIRLKNEIESNPGSRVALQSRLSKKTLSKVSE